MEVGLINIKKGLANTKAITSELSQVGWKLF